MARGYPDYFGQSMWPKYGTPIKTNVLEDNIAAGDNLDVVSIDGQGVLFDVNITLATLGATRDMFLHLRVDSSLMETVEFGSPHLYMSFAACAYLLLPTYYSPNGAVCMARLAREVPFRSSVVLNVTNHTDGIVVASGKVHHYVIT